MSETHRGKFDMFRGLAAIVVLLAHITQIFVARLYVADHPLMVFTQIAARHAVLVFFLLSGYLVTSSLVANYRRHGRVDVVQYLTARIARIYPPLIGAIGIVGVAWAIIHGFDLPGASSYGLPTDTYVVRQSFTVTAKDIVLALLMQNGMLVSNGPLWSLYMEFHIYMLALLVALACKRIAWLGLAVMLLAGWTYITGSFAFFVGIWVLGGALVLWHIPTRLLALMSTLILCIVALVAPRALTVQETWASCAVQILLCVCYAHVLFRSAAFDRQWPKTMIATGGFSYSLYVIHFPLLLLTYSVAQSWMGASMSKTLVVCAAAIPGVIGVSFLFSLFFEDQTRFKGPIRAALTLALPKQFRTHDVA